MVGFLQGLGQFGTGGFQGYQAMDQLLAQKQQREMQAAAAKAYGEAMMKMSQPQPWRVPMANDYTPPPPAMTLPNFMQAMPKSMDPAAMGMAVDRFVPIARNQQLDEYRDAQTRLGQERNSYTAARLDQQDRNINSLIDTRATRGAQGQQRLDLQERRAELAERQAALTNLFREKTLALSQMRSTNPVQKAALDRLTLEFVQAQKNVDNIRFTGVGDVEAALQAQDAIKAKLDQFDMTGMNLAQPTLAPAMTPPPAAPQPPPAPVPAPRLVPPPAAIEKLRMEPDTAKFFDQKYGPGASKQFLQPAAPQNGMPVSPGPQGGPEVVPLTMRGPDADQKRAIALRSPAEANAIDMRDRMLRDREAAASAIRPGQRAAGPAWSKPGSMATRPDIQAEVTQSPTEAPQPLVQDPETLVSGENWGVQRTDAEIRAADEKLRAALAARGVQGVDTMDRGELRIRDAMLNMVDETKPLVELYRDAAKRTGELRQKYAPKGGAQGGQSNPYLGYSMEQLNAEMKKLAAREFAARTEADRAAVKRDFDLVFKASEEMAKRRQKGS